MKITKQMHSLRLDTKNYTLDDILKEVKEDFEILESLGYSEMKDRKVSVKFGKQAKALGYCKKTTRNKIPYYTIEINKEYLSVAPAADVHNTIMHECIHCVDGCMNHGDKWKAVANKVNVKFEFTPITRTTNCPEYREVLNKKYKYFATCNTCNYTYKWMRRGRLFDSCKTGKARCNCGGRSFTCTIKN